MAPPRHFLDIDRIDAGTLRRIIDMGHAMKKAGKRVPAKLQPAGIDDAVLMLIFEKPSTRTRVSFDVAMRQLGGQTIALNHTDMQIGRGEPISDTAKVLSRYVDAIMIRANKHETLTELAKHSTVPVINGLTDRTHPCQIVADIMTFEEAKGPIKGRRIAWTGDGNNVGGVVDPGRGPAWFQAVGRLPAAAEPTQGHPRLGQARRRQHRAHRRSRRGRDGGGLRRHRHLGVHGPACGGFAAQAAAGPLLGGRGPVEESGARGHLHALPAGLPGPRGLGGRDRWAAVHRLGRS